MVDDVLPLTLTAIKSLVFRLNKKRWKYDATNVSLVAETKSVLKTNTISEKDFAQLNCFLGGKTKCIYFITRSFDLVLQQQNC